MMTSFKLIFLWVCLALLTISGTKQASFSTYTNPIIHADYSDPDVTVSPDGKTFYMTASSFQCVPGLPILRSTDLVNWTLVNHALDSVPPTDFYSVGEPRHGKGVWAPCIRQHDGEYFIYWGDPDFGIFMVKATDPEGEWSSPMLVRPGKGLIDPTPFWDSDGKAYLANGWAASRAGFNSIITISEMTPDGTRVISKPRIVYDGNDGVNHTVEGPKMYKKDGWYYLFSPAGGVATGWQLVMRSREIYGPYESKIVMAQGDSEINGPHQGGWVTTDKGEDWFIHFQDKGAYGRIIHLNPMRWKEGWPVIGDDPDDDGCGQPVTEWIRPSVSSAKSSASSVPSASSMAKYFQWHSNYSDAFGFPLPSALMRLYSHPLSGREANMWEVPNLWLMKFPDEEFVFTADLEVSAKAKTPGVSSGLIVMGWDYCRFGLTETDDGNFLLQQVICHDAETDGKESVEVIASIPAAKRYNAGITPNIMTPVKLRVAVGKDAICRFSYSLDGKTFRQAGNPFKARAGKWIGAKVGFYSVMPTATTDRGWLDILDVRVDTCSGCQTSDIFDVEEALAYCHDKVRLSLHTLSKNSTDYTMMPRNICGSDTLWHCRKSTADEWCSGFWPGILWYDYEYSGDENIREEAERYTSSLEYLSKTPAFDHDLGFLVFCSYGNGQRLTGDRHMKEVIVATADSLATLYNPAVGTILSWPRNVKMLGGHNTIMDNMINLEMLFWAAKNGGDQNLYDIAVKHADTTMRNHFRPDYTSYHVVVYDPLTGERLKGMTHQGYADDSMWARGQAWAIYGYTMVYRETGDPKYLDFARRVADVYLDRLPSDRVPYWDFDNPAIPSAPRDASAACVVASALLDLQQYCDGEAKKRYFDEAERMLRSLSGESYRSAPNKCSFLDHSTGHHPAGSEIDAAIIYADYYYLEALLKYRNLIE